MYEINSIAVANGLQLCPNEDEFFQAISKVDLTALEAVISESPRYGGPNLLRNSDGRRPRWG